MITIEINNRQTDVAVDEARLRSAVERVLVEGGFAHAEVSVAILDDAPMRRLNAEYLHHDWPTDVLSFVHDSQGDRLDGEIILSAETAGRQARRFGWPAEDELLLYAIHGALHLVGRDDHTAADLVEMRAAERRHLKHWGLTPRYEEDEVQMTNEE